MESLLSRQLFVHSGLRKEFHENTYRCVTKYFNFVSTAKVKGIIVASGDNQHAIPGDVSTFIKGELYCLNDEHDFSYVFGQLDDYEGLVKEKNEQALCRREITEVYTDDGEIVHAWIYWHNDDKAATTF